MENYKLQIVENIVNGNYSLTEQQQKLHDKISEAIGYAWNNWDADIIASYHSGEEKPEQPNRAFIENWVDNEDFDADGYDVERLKEAFA